MGSEWTYLRIGDVCAVGDGAHAKVKRLEYGIPYLTSKNIGIGTLKNESFDYISESDFNKLFPEKSTAVTRLKSGDILTGIIGTFGNFYLYKDSDLFGISSSIAIIRPDKQKIYPKYFYYYLTSSYFRQMHNAYAAGSVQGYTNLSTIRQLPAIVPPLSEQKAIANVLGSLDDKIELNRKMNATLEEMAQALFKSWFVDFDPVIDNAIIAGNVIPEEFAGRAEVRRKMLDEGTANREVARMFPDSFKFIGEMGWIPEGWECNTLNNLLEIKYGKDHKKLSEGNIPVYGSGGLMRYANNSLYEGESVLIPRKGTLTNILYLNEEFWTVDTMFYTIPKKEFIPKYVYYHLKDLDFGSMNVGSAVPSMTTKVLNQLPIVLPPKDMLQAFDTILTYYFSQIEANLAQISTLIKLRDTLLPKLISGELGIEDAKKIIKAGA